MADFTLDTSGHVPVQYGSRFIGDRAFWPDLDPFTQGYVEALLSAASVKVGGSRLDIPFGFRHLAPETLATMMKDCARATTHAPPRWHVPAWAGKTAEEGRKFYRDRQRGDFIVRGLFPPLTLYLGDDGRVYQREAA